MAYDSPRDTKNPQRSGTLVSTVTSAFAIILTTLHIICDVMNRQLGDLGVLRGVVLSFSEEARARGFPSPSFGEFGFFVTKTQPQLMRIRTLATREYQSGDRRRRLIDDFRRAGCASAADLGYSSSYGGQLKVRRLPELH